MFKHYQQKGNTIMQFNFNIGGVKVAYETQSGIVREVLIFTRSEYNYIESNHTLIEAIQTTKGANHDEIL